MSLLDTASLIVTPSAYKEGTLYSVIPSDGSGDLSVVRATTATRVNSAGLVELVPYNLLSYSSSFVTAPWQSNATRTANAATAPDGTMTATRVQFASGSAQYLYQGAPDIASGTATISCWIKGATAQKIGFNDGNTIGNSINITTEWVRYEFTLNTNGVDLGLQFDNYFGVSPAQQAKDFYVWGAQLVEGSTALPYQKTETRLNIPRLDYSNGTCPSILVEPQRTNLLTYSSSFDNAAWTKLRGAITANNTSSPSGYLDADLFIPDTTNNNHTIFTTISSGQRTFSVFAKASGYNYIFLGVNNNAASDGVFFDLSNGTISQNTSGLIANITSFGNGWYRCDAYSNTWSTLAVICTSQNGNSFIHTGDGTSGVFLWGAQVEAGSYPTSYIPTTSASVTRNADVISKTGISSLIGQTEGTLFVDYLFNENTPNLTSNDNILLGLNDGTTNNLIVIIHYGSSASAFGKKIRFFVRTSGATQASIDSAAQTSGRYKVAVTYASNSFKLFVNGVLIGQDTSGTVPATSAAYLYDFIANLGTLQNYINGAALWPTALTNDELERLTGTGFNTYAEMANYYNYITQ